MFGKSLFRKRGKRRGDAAAFDTGASYAGAPEPPRDPLLAHETLGEALKAARLERGLSLEAVAEVTRIRRAYLEAIEAMQLESLPSRPFTIGYIRAFADALGLNPALAVERFRAEEPILDEGLRAPVGLLEERDPRIVAFLLAALAMILAIVLWNVAQRAMMSNAPPPPLAPPAFAEQALRGMKPGPVNLGAPLPAPVESTTPPPYETPGLAEAMGLPTPVAVANAPRVGPDASPVDLASLPRTFVPAGKIYEVGGRASPVILQALKPASLILRGPDGSVYFARQFAKGEALRTPLAPGLTVDVSNANDFQIFAGGQSRGVLPAQQVLASKLAPPPPPPQPAVAPPHVQPQVQPQPPAPQTP